MRRCLICGTRAPKTHLIRFARGDDAPTIDHRQRLPGRGAYMCASPECFEQLLSRRGGERRLAYALRLPPAQVTRHDLERLVTAYSQVAAGAT